MSVFEASISTRSEVPAALPPTTVSHGYTRAGSSGSTATRTCAPARFSPITVTVLTVPLPRVPRKRNSSGTSGGGSCTVTATEAVAVAP